LIDVSDQFAFSYVSNPVLGSNGETLFFVVEQMDYEPGISRFQIMRQALADGSVTELTADDHDSWQPVLSNDGRSLFFLSNRAGGTTQLWKKSLNDDGRAVQITDVEAGVDDINFSSDQTRLLLVRKDKKTSPPLVQGSQPWVIDRLSFKRDYEGYVTHQYDHIYV
jgi:dipeptidyl aminopeptidase/acylaminoacyl peptidase